MAARAEDVVGAEPASRRRIVGYNPGLSTVAAGVLVGVFVFSWILLAAPPNDAGNLVNVLPPICVLATLVCLLGTCRLVVDPDGFVDVIDPLVVRRVPVAELVGVEHDDGLHLRVVSTRRIGSFAYGSSLLGALLHYPRSVRAAQRIEAAIGGFQAVSQWPLPPDNVTTRLRIRAVVGTLAVDVVLVLGTVVVNTIETAAQR